MSDKRFNLIFDGKLEPDYDLASVRESLSSLFEFETGDLERIFSGLPIVLAESMDAATANAFSLALSGAGAVTRLEAVEIPADSAGEEQRLSRRRIVAARRESVRAAAILPDRRHSTDRRS